MKKKYENSSQVQRSRSNVIDFQPLLVFPRDILLPSYNDFQPVVFRDFVWTDTQMPSKTLPARSMRAGNETTFHLPQSHC